MAASVLKITTAFSFLVVFLAVVLQWYVVCMLRTSRLLMNVPFNPIQAFKFVSYFLRLIT